MKVWIFQTGEPLHCDKGSHRGMRAMNLADSLVRAGHVVTIWSSAYFHQEKKHRVRDYKKFYVSPSIEIRLVPSRGYARNVSLMRMIDHAELAINLCKILYKEKSSPDVAFVGFPPVEFAYVAVRWLRARSIPFMLDVKDKWPHIFVKAFPSYMRLIMLIVFSPYFYMARSSMRNANALCSMAPSFLEWCREFSLKETSSYDFVAPLSPAADNVMMNELDNAVSWWRERGIKDDETKRFFFVGSFGKALNIKDVVKAAKNAELEGLNWQFVICGNGERYSDFVEIFENINNVKLVGWVDRPKIIALSRMSIAGLAPYYNREDFIISVPNKIIDYLSLGKPIITPLKGEVEKVILDYHVGLIYDDTKSNSLYDSLKEISTNDKSLKLMAINSKELYRKKYSGDSVYNELAIKLISLVV